MEQPISPLPSSYRDPSGFIFTRNGVLYRQVNRVFRDDFELFLQSGLYRKLAEKKWLIPHEPVAGNLTGSEGWYATLRPDPIPFISYPYEWSFGMLKEAALLTLGILRESLAHGLVLKDATPYNLQWLNGRMIFIDTLSFERYREEEPWIAYRQFCEQFLGPLLLMHYRRQPLQPLSLAWPEGIPLELTHALLPWRSKFSLHTYLHIHLNARVSAKSRPGAVKTARFSKQKMLNLLSSLETLTRKLRLPERKSAWSGYYAEAAGRDQYLEAKKTIIRQWLQDTGDCSRVLDLGANEGDFARMTAERNMFTIAADFDPACIERLYQSLKKTGEKNIQPLILDLAYPSPAIGVNNAERDAFISRAGSDLVMALALIHHLAIGKNIPLPVIADFFRRLSRKWLIVEFVPKTDEKIQLMLSGKKDIYEGYSEELFESVFNKYYRILKKQPIGASGRSVYLMIKNEG